MSVAERRAERDRADFEAEVRALMPDEPRRPFSVKRFLEGLGIGYMIGWMAHHLR